MSTALSTALHGRCYNHRSPCKRIARVETSAACVPHRWNAFSAKHLRFTVTGPDFRHQTILFLVAIVIDFNIKWLIIRTIQSDLLDWFECFSFYRSFVSNLAGGLNYEVNEGGDNLRWKPQLQLSNLLSFLSCPKVTLASYWCNLIRSFFFLLPWQGVGKHGI